MAAAVAGMTVLGTVAGQKDTEAQDRQQLKDFQTAYEKAKKSLAAHPKSTSARHEFVVSTDRLATATMTSLVLGPKDKYPKALRLYREALKIDPKNREASSNAKLIEDVYRSMHRPIPH